MDRQGQERWQLAVLIILFVGIAALRIGLAYQSPMPDYGAYEHLRQVQSIHETGKPLFHDELSFGGRLRVFSPLYDYVLAFFGLFMPSAWLVKVLPNIFAAAIVFPAFAIGEHLTQKRWLGVVTAAMTGLVPATFMVSLNDASPLMLSVTLLVASIYLFMRSRNSGRHVQWLLGLIVAMVVLQPISVVFLLGLALYVVLLQVLRSKTTGKDIEVLLFTLFFTAWFSMVVFKKAFVAHGAAVIWQNIPSPELASIFSRLTLLEAIAGVGLITLIMGSYALYDGIMKAQRKPLLLLASMVLSVIVLVWFRLAALSTGLALLGVLLAVASAHSLGLIVSFVGKTKASRLAVWTVAGVMVLFLITGLPAILTQQLLDTPSQADIKVLSWAQENLPPDAIILASPKEGSMIEYVARRATVIDDDYLLVPHALERYTDAQKVYTSYFKTDAVSLMQKYGADYLYLSVQTKAFSGVLLPEYINDGCFDPAREYRDSSGFKVWLYERTCSVRGENDA